MDIASPIPQDLQAKLYFPVKQLQHMAGELPPKYQMRVPYELLSGLANSLLNDTIFAIVKARSVADQKSILEKAGVPGFYVTNNHVRNKHKS
ncbi:Gonadal protein gdl [Temnothorax longispinosus]|uniref:Gonadal protein gdl n=1 Tax=Temnothorax longispinosus TaxID=300112 RepID=A0A4S2KIZ0_9HYME|nr:Gonadal protein gdl [Temnothorax longispinosus]